MIVPSSPRSLAWRERHGGRIPKLLPESCQWRFGAVFPHSVLGSCDSLVSTNLWDDDAVDMIYSDQRSDCFLAGQIVLAHDFCCCQVCYPISVGNQTDFEIADSEHSE